MYILQRVYILSVGREMSSGAVDADSETRRQPTAGRTGASGNSDSTTANSALPTIAATLASGSPASQPHIIDHDVGLLANTCCQDAGLVACGADETGARAQGQESISSSKLEVVVDHRRRLQPHADHCCRELVGAKLLPECRSSYASPSPRWQTQRSQRTTANQASMCGVVMFATEHFGDSLQFPVASPDP